MPKATFTGVRLMLVGPMSVTVSYPDVVSMETFLAMKGAVDDVVQPKILGSESEGKADPSRKGNP